METFFFAIVAFVAIVSSIMVIPAKIRSTARYRLS